MKRILSHVTLFCATLVVLAVAIHVLLADDDIAKSFLAKGDEFMKKGESNRALEFYQKALKEGAEMPEVHFKLGDGYLNTGDKAKSRACYKKCIELLDAVEKPTSAMKELKKKAQQQITSLDAVAKEGKAIEQEYIKELLAYAKKIKAKDNLLAEEALKRILTFEPEHSEALKTLDEIRKNAVFKRWQAFFDGTLDGWFPQDSSLWKISDDNVLTADVKKSQTNVRRGFILKRNYGISIEFKIDESYAEGHAIGIMIGCDVNLGISKTVMIFEENSVKLVNFEDGKGIDMNTASVLDTYRKGDWNKLQLDVADNCIKIYINDKLFIEDTSQVKGFYDGEIGLWAQRCKVKFANAKYSK